MKPIIPYETQEHIKNHLITLWIEQKAEEWGCEPSDIEHTRTICPAGQEY
ncbi:MAG: hypothetical protein FWG91_11205 [Lachnospiraceae bacterium]|nr:hypothetical protein [Lachnospiraceae bacterium]